MQLEEKLSADHKRAEQEPCLTQLMTEGDSLKNQWVEGLEQRIEWMRRYGEWNMRVRSEVERAFSAAHADRLFALRIEVDRNSYFFDGVHQESHARVCAIVGELHVLLRRLSATN